MEAPRRSSAVLKTTWLIARTRALCRFALQIGFLFLIFRAGQWGVGRFHLPVPGNVLGMLVLFVLLSLGLVRETWIQEGATLLTKHLAFFFIPIAVGLMEWWPLFRIEGHWLLLALLVSTLATLLATGGLVQALSSSHPHRGGPWWEILRSSSAQSSSPSASTR
jgi:holin-like protein